MVFSWTNTKRNIKNGIQHWISVFVYISHPANDEMFEKAYTFCHLTNVMEKEVDTERYSWQLDLISTSLSFLRVIFIGQHSTALHWGSALSQISNFHLKFHHNHLYRKENGVNMRFSIFNVLIPHTLRLHIISDVGLGGAAFIAIDVQLLHCSIYRQRMTRSSFFCVVFPISLLLCFRFASLSFGPNGKIKMKWNCIYIH